ncbi:IS66 family insertion sequence element accessory protein TnpB [Sphingomonas faeni]|uniref:IS66 family insertion sequence element accessory protein TnpB n=1 Tax=Sphingomonas faeni TaxID=185950 RepID=UPI00359318B9
MATQIQRGFVRNPHAGDLYVSRGRCGDLLKILWHDGLGMSLYAKRLERVVSLGQQHLTASFPFRRGNWASFWKASAGSIHDTR